jgi:F-type H+-transporting ATPase subunit epsilon
MAQDTFKLTILTPDRVVFDGEAEYVYVPGGAGYMGVLPHHAALIASLVPGRFEVRRPGKPQAVFTTKAPGLFEVNKNAVSVLLDVADTGVVIA